jgi:hypothetical protein
MIRLPTAVSSVRTYCCPVVSFYIMYRNELVSSSAARRDPRPQVDPQTHVQTFVAVFPAHFFS